MAIAVAPAQVESGLTPSEKRHFSMLESRIERGMQTFREVGLALLEIRDKRLFRLSHPSFEAYCRDRWQLERQRAYQLMGAAEVTQVLPEGKGPINESQARELVPLLNSDPTLVQKVWAEVEARNEPVTAQVIREVVRDLTADSNGGGRVEHARPITPTAKLVAQIAKVRADIEVWAGTHPTRAEKKQVVVAVQQVVEALE